MNLSLSTRRIILFRALLNEQDTCVNGVWDVLMDFVTLKQTIKCNKNRLTKKKKIVAASL